MRRLNRVLLGMTVLGGVLAVLASQSGAGSLFSSGYLGTVAPGTTVTVTADGFKPNSPVTIQLQPPGVTLGAATADASGSVNITEVIPAGTASGNHTIAVIGVNSAGAKHEVDILVDIQPAAPVAPLVKATSVSLPFTGTNTELLAAVGIMAVLLGGVALRGGRRRRSEADRSRV